MFNQVVNTPAWIKVFCPTCIGSCHITEESLQEIKNNFLELKSQVEVSSKEIQSLLSTVGAKPTYSGVVSKKLETDVKQTNRLVGDLLRRQASSNTIVVSLCNSEVRMKCTPACGTVGVWR